MHKKSRYTTVCLWMISLAVIIGGWFFTKLLLDAESGKLLRQKGTVDKLSAGGGFWESSSDKESSGEENSENKMEDLHQSVLISDKTLFEVLKAQEETHTNELHEPNEKQLYMGEAIAAGVEWIQIMIQNGLILQDWDGNYEKIDAKLYCPRKSGAIQENDNYELSCWQIDYYLPENSRIQLTLHARTGVVLYAKITAGGMWLWKQEDEEKTLLTAFPFLKGRGGELIRTDEVTYWLIPDMNICAAIKEYKELKKETKKETARMETKVDQAIYSCTLSLWLETVENGF